MIQVITEKEETYAWVSVPVNFATGAISGSGKSISYRVNGTYLAKSGHIKGRDGQLSPILSKRLPFIAKGKGSYLLKSNVIRHNFDGAEHLAFKVFKA